MFEIMSESHDDLLALKASAALTADDYEKVLIPKLNELFKTYPKLKMLIEFDEDFSCWASPKAAWDDMKIGLEHPNDFSKIALVGAPDWVIWGLNVYGLFVRGEFKSFDRANKDQALAWLEQP